MKKILVLQGVPASGKSTWAKEFIKGKKDWVIVSRDNIRESTGEYWVPERENYITELEEYAIESALKNNLNVVIDATNLNPKTTSKWINLANKEKVEIEFKMFKISYKEALERDTNRERPVGKKVIRTFFSKYFPDEIAGFSDNRKIKEADNHLPDAIICDIDGTVALRNNRSPFDYSKVLEDTFDPRMKVLLNALQNHHVKLIFVSGREGTEQCVRDTKKWIGENIDEHINWTIIFRKAGDYRNDAEVKQEIYDNQIKNRYNVVAVFDDRDRVVKMWRDMGLLCLQVYYGDF